MDFNGFDYEALQNAREYARLQDEINSGLEGYIEGVKNIKKLQKDLKTAGENLNKLKAEEKRLSNAITDEDKEKLKLTKARIALIESEVEKIKKTKEYYTEIVKDAKKWDMLGGRILASTVKTAASLDKLPSIIANVTNQLKDLFEMDKAIRRASLQMGLIGEQSGTFRKNIKSAAEDTQKLGIGIKELAELQAQFSENIGRNVSMSKEDLKALAQISEGTSLGTEATAQMAADFEAQGVSALRTRDYIEEAANRSSAMGLNTTKVLKNLGQNMKMLNKYRFKDGIKGLVKMSELSSRLGVDMEFVSGFADKLWNVEGAVETAAQLNVMGGAFARLGDPFKLMYMARNDIAGLTEQLAEAAAESATFNKQNGEFEIGAMDMHRLKIIADQTGLSYEQLTTAAKNAAKFAKIKTQIPFKLDDDAKAFIENTAKLDEKGRAYIEVKGEKKFLSQLGSSGQQIIQAQVKEKKNLEERALAAKSFDEQIVNLINMVKSYMMPIVEGLTEVLKPFVEDLMGEKGDAFKKELKSLGEQIGWFVKEAAGWVKWVAEVAVALGPKGIFYTWLTGKALMFLFEAGKWVLNGLALSEGFLMGTKGMPGLDGGGGGGDTGKSMLGTKRGAGFKANFKGAAGSKLLKLGGVATGLLEAYGEYGEQKDKGKSTGEAVGRAALKGTGAGLGAWGGAAAGAAIGSVVPVVGTAIGALIGGALGAWGGGKVADLDTYGVDDGIVQFNKNDKFTKVDDSTMVAGTNKNGNKDLAKVLKYGMLASTPLGWPLLMSEMMKGGSSSTSSGGSSNKIEFGELHITGEIKINLPGGTQMATELVKSQEFKSSITRIVTSQLEKNVNGGKHKG